MQRLRSEETVRLARASVVVSPLYPSRPLPFRRDGRRRAPGRSFVLPNGLKVFLYEKHDLPLVNIALAVDAGSKDETEATNGVAHLLEHCLLFRGTEFRSGSEVSRDLRRRGAYFNANTGQDLTVFELACPSGAGRLRPAQSARDRLRFRPRPRPSSTSEKDVVLEELKQTEDDPERHGPDLVHQRLFAGHPYGRPVTGRPEVIRSAPGRGPGRLPCAILRPQ